MHDKEKKQTFELNSSVYSKELGCYVFLKKFDEEKKTYDVKIIKKDKSEEKKDKEEELKIVNSDTLTQIINVQIRLIDSAKIQTMGTCTEECPSTLINFKVVTSDPVKTLVERIGQANIGGNDLIMNGKFIEDQDLTFQ